MKRKRHSTDEIIRKLREAVALESRVYASSNGR